MSSEGKTFLKELEELINRHSMENNSDTPDFLLAEYLCACLTAYNKATRRRDGWYNFHPFFRRPNK